jgi:hypothetical protein
MAYYTALITAWNLSIQPPTGALKPAISANDCQKLTNVNA